MSLHLTIREHDINATALAIVAKTGSQVLEIIRNGSPEPFIKAPKRVNLLGALLFGPRQIPGSEFRPASY